MTVAGRRGGKTFGCGARILWAATNPGSLIGYMAPTYGMAKRLMWDWLKEHTPRDWVRTMHRSDLVMELSNGSRIMLFGSGNYNSARGMGFDHFEFDEVQDIPSEAWSEVVRPALSDRQGSAGFRGTPKGRGNFLYDLATMARGGGWDCHTYTTLEGGLVPASEIEAAKGGLDERTFRQEYEASFESSGSLVYYAFDDLSLVDCPFDPLAPVYMSWDFNTTDKKPMVCLLIQYLPTRENPQRHVLTREFVHVNTNTEEMCLAVKAFFDTHRFAGPLEVTGDYAGNRRESNASQSDYELIRKHFGSRPGYRVRNRVVTAIQDRVAATNSMFKSYDGTRKLYIDRSARNTIEDLLRTEWKSSGTGLDNVNGLRTDETDALSYFPYNYFPVHRRAPVYTQ